MSTASRKNMRSIRSRSGRRTASTSSSAASGTRVDNAEVVNNAPIVWSRLRTSVTTSSTAGAAASATIVKRASAYCTARRTSTFTSMTRCTTTA